MTDLTRPDITLPSPAKLNLFLHITGRRPDGYHELQTLFDIRQFDLLGVPLESAGPRGAGLLGASWSWLGAVFQIETLDGISIFIVNS